MFLVKNIFFQLFSYKLFLTFSIITVISIYFSFLSWFFFVTFLILILFILSKSIFLQNKNIFYLIIICFFIKFFFSKLLYTFWATGYPLGTIGGSDDISYFLKGKLLQSFKKRSNFWFKSKTLFNQFIW